ncbi:hypothetical protein ACTJJ0_04090 [Chitinophaga sp. 22321]|uniref:Heparan-alpha-glucosaminide N-acetyltransferase catalytic domain-containing protein n=1 Tax=Chitinophaga hostae TaxID=2831022 RepID=A0ABS5J075_9BACT|nr:hypothetical protein [Chitinophaga hostae]MBS0027822.1 hypothetical protein [Chitinophaga hostae]
MIDFKVIHRRSGQVLAVFILLHITNHLFSLGGPELHATVMTALRKIYRFPPVECLLLLCVAIQIFSGLLLIFKKSERKISAPQVIQRVSGFYLAAFMCNHIRAVMMGRFVWKVETGFQFAAGGAAHLPSAYFFIPYYFLSVVAVFFHVASIHYIKSNDLLVHLPDSNIPAAKRRIKVAALTIASVGVVTAVCIIGAMVKYG